MISKGTGTLNDITVSIEYTDKEIEGLIESSLVIYRFTGGQWIALSTTIDEENNIATATTPGFSTFSLGRNKHSICISLFIIAFCWTW